MIIEKVNRLELQEVVELDSTKRGSQGFGSSTTIKDQSAKEQSPRTKIEINKISEKAFGQLYGRGEEIGILKWDEVDNEIQPEAINISTELAIKSKRNNEKLSTKDIGPKEYYHMLDVLEKGEKTTVPPHRPGVDLGIELENGKEVPIKIDIPTELRPDRRITPAHQTKSSTRMDPASQNRKSVFNHVCQKKGWQTQTVCRLLSTQQNYQERSTSTPSHWRGTQQIGRSQILCQVGHQRPLLQHFNQGRRQIQDSIFDQVGNIRIPSHAIRNMQCTISIPTMD